MSCVGDFQLTFVLEFSAAGVDNGEIDTSPADLETCALLDAGLYDGGLQVLFSLEMLLKINADSKI